MKKEYAVQAYNEERWGNEWHMKTTPDDTYIEAMRKLQKIRDFCRKSPGKKYKTTITQFRIVVREVSEWEVVE